MKQPQPISTLFPYTTLFRSEEIKHRLRAFLRDELKLELSEEKTLITHARDSAANFLGYEITTRQSNTKQRSEEHTSELQSHSDLVCRLLLEKKNTSHHPKRQ